MNFIVSLGLYPFHIMVSIGQTEEALTEALKGYNIPEKDIRKKKWTLREDNRGKALMFSNGATVIRLVEGPVSPAAQGIIAHEVFHAVTFILSYKIGMKLTKESDEAFAYAIGYVTEQIYERYENSIAWFDPADS